MNQPRQITGIGESVVIRNVPMTTPISTSSSADTNIANLVLLATGEYVSKDEFNKLSSADQAYLKKHGVEAFNKEQFNIATEGLTEAQKAYIEKHGVEAFNKQQERLQSQYAEIQAAAEQPQVELTGQQALGELQIAGKVPQGAKLESYDTSTGRLEYSVTTEPDTTTPSSPSIKQPTADTALPAQTKDTLADFKLNNVQDPVSGDWYSKNWMTEGGDKSYLAVMMQNSGASESDSRAALQQLFNVGGIANVNKHFQNIQKAQTAAFEAANVQDPITKEWYSRNWMTTGGDNSYFNIMKANSGASDADVIAALQALFDYGGMANVNSHFQNVEQAKVQQMLVTLAPQVGTTTAALQKVYNESGIVGVNELIAAVNYENEAAAQLAKSVKVQSGDQALSSLKSQGAIPQDAVLTSYNPDTGEVSYTSESAAYDSLTQQFLAQDDMRVYEYLQNLGLDRKFSNTYIDYRISTGQLGHSMFEDLSDKDKEQVVKTYANFGGKTPLEALYKMNLAVVPIVGTIATWDEMSTPWKIASVVGDVLFVLPTIKPAIALAKAGESAAAVRMANIVESAAEVSSKLKAAISYINADERGAVGAISEVNRLKTQLAGVEKQMQNLPKTFQEAKALSYTDKNAAYAEYHYRDLQKQVANLQDRIAGSEAKAISSTGATQYATMTAEKAGLTTTEIQRLDNIVAKSVKDVVEATPVLQREVAKANVKAPVIYADDVINALEVESFEKVLMRTQLAELMDRSAAKWAEADLAAATEVRKAEEAWVNSVIAQDAARLDEFINFQNFIKEQKLAREAEALKDAIKVSQGRVVLEKQASVARVVSRSMEKLPVAARQGIVSGIEPSVNIVTMSATTTLPISTISEMTEAEIASKFGNMLSVNVDVAGAEVVNLSDVTPQELINISTYTVPEIIATTIVEQVLNPSTITVNKTDIQTAINNITDVDIRNKVQEIVDTKLKEATETKTATEIETKTATEIKPETKTITEIETKTKTAEEEKVSEPDRIPRVITPFPFPGTSRGKKKTREAFRGAIAWKQGFGWWAIKAPYRSYENDVAFFYKTPPPEAQIVEGGPRSAYKSIQAMGVIIPEKLRVDLGFEDITIYKPSNMPGARGAIKYERERANQFLEEPYDIQLKDKRKSRPKRKRSSQIINPKVIRL